VTRGLSGLAAVLVLLLATAAQAQLTANPAKPVPEVEEEAVPAAPMPDGQAPKPVTNAPPQALPIPAPLEGPGAGAPPPDAMRPPEGPPTSGAILRTLDKVTARSQTLDVPNGQTIRYRSLAITVRACKTRPPEEAPESAAFLEIDETAKDGTQRVFTGWMFASSPALNALEHPVYDVWVTACKTAAPSRP